MLLDSDEEYSGTAGSVRGNSQATKKALPRSALLCAHAPFTDLLSVIREPDLFAFVPGLEFTNTPRSIYNFLLAGIERVAL